MIKRKHVFAPIALILAIGVQSHSQEAAPPVHAVHTPGRQFQFAEGLLQRRFYDMAEQEFRKFMDRNPDHELAPYAMFRLIECLRALKKQPETMSTINQFQKRFPSHELSPKLFLWKGELLLQLEKYKQAEAGFRRLLISKDSVTREAAVYFLGQCYAKQGQLEDALIQYEKIAHLDFDDTHLYRPYAQYALATADKLKGNFSESEQAFERLASSDAVPDELRGEALYRLGENSFLKENYKRAVEYYEQLLVEYPNSFFASESRKRRAWAYYLLEDYAKTIDLCNEWKLLYPTRFDYELEYILAASNASSGNIDNALKIFKELYTSPRTPDEYKQLAAYQQTYIRLQQGKWQKALDLAAQYLNNYPDSSRSKDINYFSGEAHFNLGNISAAEKSLKTALTFSSDDWEFFIQTSIRLADCLEQQQNYPECAAVYRSLSKAPKAESPASMLLTAGIMERKAGNPDGAAADFKALLFDFPDAASQRRRATMLLGEIYAEKEKFKQAEELVSELVRNPQVEKKGRLTFFLGYLAYRQENYETAKTLLEKAIESRESESVINDARYFLTGTLLELDKEDEALDTFSKLLSLPIAERPAFSDSFLFKLERLYYKRLRFKTSEEIAVWLGTNNNPDTAFKANLRLAQSMIAQDRFQEAVDFLRKCTIKYRENNALSKTNASLDEINSLLGEAYLKLGEDSTAAQSFQQTLGNPDVRLEFSTRANWGMAEIMLKQGRLNQAHRYSVNAYILGNDDYYTPRAMLVAVKALFELERSAEAKETWQEVKKRFPVFAAEKNDNKVIIKINESI